jgi:hypothetical protein
MATSTNYGWAEPDNSSLVKNGASDIRTLGNAIDTSVWNVGFGQAGKNKVINGDFGIWQRGTSVNTTTYGYTADRWLGYQYGSVTVSRQATADTTVLPFIQYCARVQRPSGQTGLNPIYFNQSLESAASIPFAGKTVAISFYARRGSNYSSASNVLTAQVISGTGTDQNVVVGSFTGATQVVAPAVTLTTTWQRFTATGTVGSTATQLGVVFTYTPVGTASTNDYFEVTGVQLEAGSIATPFQTASGGSPQAELAMCQRYYQVAGSYSFGGRFESTTVATIWGVLPVQMRTTPTLSYTSFASAILVPGVAFYTPTAVTFGGSSSSFQANFTGMTGGVIGNMATINVGSNLSAEL